MKIIQNLDLRVRHYNKTLLYFWGGGIGVCRLFKGKDKLIRVLILYCTKALAL